MKAFKVAYSRGPNHSGRPDEKASHHTSQSESHRLCRQDQEDLEAPSEELFIEKLLSQQNIKGVTECGSSSSHDNNDGVLLHVEWSLWVELKMVTKQTELPVGHESVPALAHRVGDELDDSWRDSNRRATE